MPGGKRRRHKIGLCEEAIKLAESKKWRIDDSKKYYKLKCPCELKHIKTVHRTPSDPNYCKNLMAWLRRQSCMREEDRP